MRRACHGTIFRVCLVSSYLITAYPLQAAPGTEGADFLSIPVGAGPAALGSAYSALATDAYAPVWNPAGLGMLSSTQVAAQHLSYVESINYEFITITHPVRPGHSLGASIQYLGSGDIPSTDRSGGSLGTFSSHYAAYSLAYGQAVTDKLSLGLTGKWIEAKISDVGAQAYATDLGSLYRASDHITFAGVVANVGSKLKFLSDGDSLPMAVRLGGAYQERIGTVALEGVYQPESRTANVHTGMEWKALESVALRAGYRTDVQKELSPLAGFSVGLGLKVWGQEFSYAWLPYGDLGDSQYFSFVARFGGSPEYNPVIHSASRVVSNEETDSLTELLQYGDGTEKIAGR